MEKNKKLVLVSVLIALIALFIVMLILSFIILNQKAKKAGVENIINPFAINSIAGASSVNIYSGTSSDSDDDDDDDPIDGNPYISAIPDITMPEDSVFTLSLDNYVRDDNHSLSQLTWNFSGNTNINVSINNTTHVATFAPLADWNGAENITFRVTDPDGLYDTDTIIVTVTPVDDATIWGNLSNQVIAEDSPAGTIVYANITGRAIDNDSNVTITVMPNIHFQLSLSGNDLVVSSLQKDWYGNETVNLNANGVTASFTLTVTHELDDCVKICSWGKCYEYCD